MFTINEALAYATEANCMVSDDFTVMKTKCFSVKHKFTGQKVIVQSVNIVRKLNHKVVNGWSVEDHAGKSVYYWRGDAIIAAIGVLEAEAMKCKKN